MTFQWREVKPGIHRAFEVPEAVTPPQEPPKVGTWAEGWLCDCALHHRSLDRCYSCHTLRPPLPDSKALEAEVAWLWERAAKVKARLDEEL